MNNTVKTVSDAREEKARQSGDYEAYACDMQARREVDHIRKYLRLNPDVGELWREGKQVFYTFKSGTYVEITRAAVLKTRLPLF